MKRRVGDRDDRAEREGGKGADHKVVEVGHKAADTTTTATDDTTTPDASSSTGGTTS